MRTKLLAGYRKLAVSSRKRPRPPLRVPARPLAVPSRKCRAISGGSHSAKLQGERWLFDQAPSRERLGPLPVWPYYFLSAVAGLAAVGFVAVWWPQGYPDDSELVKVSGEVATVIVRDDISKTSAGAMLPAMTSIYFTLKGVEGEFRYPSSHPNYLIVRDRTAIAIDIWVDGAEIGTGRPMTIWQIQEHNPFKLTVEQTFVSHAEVIERLTKTDRSMVETGYWLLGVAGAFALIGVGVRRWNRGRPPPIA